MDAESSDEGDEEGDEENEEEGDWASVGDSDSAVGDGGSSCGWSQKALRLAATGDRQSERERTLRRMGMTRRDGDSAGDWDRAAEDGEASWLASTPSRPSGIGLPRPPLPMLLPMLVPMLVPTLAPTLAAK